jgi:heat shock protein HtpX
MPAPADYIDTLDEMLPQAAADEMLAELWQDADAAFTANEQPTLMQACVWLLLWVYAGAKNAEGQGGGVQGDAVQIAAFTAEVLAAPLQTASVRLSQQRWQNIQAALNDAAALPEPERRRILADCIQIAEASPDLLRAQTWLYTLRVAWDLPSEAV